MLKVLCLIPARGGSKGVPKKNLRMLGGRPLLVWSIRAADTPLHPNTLKPAPLYETRVVVSTDDEQIAAVARLAGAETIMRPAELATDEAATDPVIVHAVEYLKAGGWRPDLVVLLQPTVPVRPAGIVYACIARLLDTGADSLFTGHRLLHVWQKRSGRGWWMACLTSRVRRQDMPDHEVLVHEDGCVFVTRTELLEQTGQRLGGKVAAYVIPRTVDIDTEDDLREAAVLLRNKLGRESAA